MEDNPDINAQKNVITNYLKDTHIYLVFDKQVHGTAIIQDAYTVGYQISINIKYLNHLSHVKIDESRTCDTICKITVLLCNTMKKWNLYQYKFWHVIHNDELVSLDKILPNVTRSGPYFRQLGKYEKIVILNIDKIEKCQRAEELATLKRTRTPTKHKMLIEKMLHETKNEGKRNENALHQKRMIKLVCDTSFKRKKLLTSHEENEFKCQMINTSQKENVQKIIDFKNNDVSDDNHFKQVPISNQEPLFSNSDCVLETEMIDLSSGRIVANENGNPMSNCTFEKSPVNQQYHNTINNHFIHKIMNDMQTELSAVVQNYFSWRCSAIMNEFQSKLVNKKNVLDKICVEIAQQEQKLNSINLEIVKRQNYLVEFNHKSESVAENDLIIKNQQKKIEEQKQELKQYEEKLQQLKLIFSK